MRVVIFSTAIAVLVIFAIAGHRQPPPSVATAYLCPELDPAQPSCKVRP